MKMLRRGGCIAACPSGAQAKCPFLGHGERSVSKAECRKIIARKIHFAKSDNLKRNML